MKTPKYRIEYTATVTDTETGAVLAAQTLDCHVSGPSAVHEVAKGMGSTLVTALSYTLTKDTIIGIDGDKKGREGKPQ